MRVTLLHNPASGDASTSPADLEAILSRAGYQVRYRSTKSAWKNELEDPGDLVVVAGGDGTVKEAVTALAGSGVPVAILPFGTANNVAKALGVVGETAQIVAGWRGREPEPLDLGNASAGWGEAQFVESAGGGALAELIARGETHVESAGSIVGRETDRALYLLRTILEEATPEPWQVEVDGRDQSGNYVAVEALNIRFAGPNIPLARDADPSDGMLDVVLVGADERGRLLTYVRNRLEHASARLRGMPVIRAHRVRLVAPPNRPFHLDDRSWSDEHGRWPGRVELAVLPGAARIVRPDPG